MLPPITLTLCAAGTNELSSFVKRLTIPGNKVLPPLNTILPYKSRPVQDKK